MFATLVLLALSAAMAFGGEENVAYFDDLKCDFNSEYCGKSVCSMTPHNNKQDEQTISISCELKKSIDDMRFKTIIFAKELQLNLVDIEEDFCNFMNGSKDAKVLAVVMPFIKQHSNINHACPYTGSVAVNAMPLGSHLLESHDVPSGDYVVSSTVFTNGMTLFNNTFLLHIPEGKSIVAGK